MRNFRKLRVTDAARAVIRATYAFTAALPRSEQFGLTSQMRRAAVSTGLNIAEGSTRESTREFIRYLQVVRGSATELEFAVLVCEDLGYGTDESRASLSDQLLQLQRQISAFISVLRRRAEQE